MSPKSRSCWRVSCGGCLLLLGGFGTAGVLLHLIPDEDLSTVDGPETHEVRARATGTVVMTTLSEGLEIVDLPGLDRRDRPTSGRVWHVAGPDREGTVLHDESGADGTMLKATQLDSEAATVLLVRSGDWPFWEQTMFECLAVSPVGKRFAFLTRCGDSDLPVTARCMRIEAWAFEGRAEPLRSFEVEARDRALAWSADGKRLFYVELGERAESAESSPHEAARSLQGLHELVPIVYVMDIESGDVQPVHEGRRVIASQEDEQLLIRVNEHEWHRFDVASAECHPLDLPGMLLPVAFVGQRTILYEGLTTTGHEPKKLFSTKRAQWMWSLKVASWDSGEFATVVPHIGRFHQVSFGMP